MRPRIAHGHLVVVICLAAIFTCFGQPSLAQDDEDLKPQSENSVQVPSPSKDSGSDAVPEPTPSMTSKPVRPQLIDTSIEESANQSPSTQTQEPSGQYKDREAKLPEVLKKLVQAPHIYDLSRGGSSVESDALLQALALGPSIREDLLFIVESGSPAGRIYAAYLISQFDQPEGKQILDRFKTEKTLVVNKSYSSSEHYTMGEVATDLVSPRPSIILKKLSR